MNKLRLRITNTLAVDLATRLADGRVSVTELQPRDEDYDLVFTPSAAASARRGYASLWRKPPAITACAPEARVRAGAIVARAGDLGAGVRGFPPAYRAIAGELRPAPIWSCFTFCDQAGRSQRAFDGLVAVAPTRFAWFPLPWRAFAAGTLQKGAE